MPKNVDGKIGPCRIKTALHVGLTTGGLSVAILACGGAWATHRFESIANALTFIRGERLLFQGPSIEAEQTPRDGHVMLRYRLLNLAGHSIKLVGARSSCSCTVVGDLPATIGDRESFSIPIDVSLPEPPARASATVTLFTDDSEHPEVKLAFQADRPGAVPAAGVAREGR